MLTSSKWFGRSNLKPKCYFLCHVTVLRKCFWVGDGCANWAKIAAAVRKTKDRKGDLMQTLKVVVSPILVMILCIYCWLVVSNTNFIFHFIYGMSSFPLTNSYFSRWLLHPQPDWDSSVLLARLERNREKLLAYLCTLLLFDDEFSFFLLGNP